MLVANPAQPPDELIYLPGLALIGATVLFGLGGSSKIFRIIGNLLSTPETSLFPTSTVCAIGLQKLVSL